MALNTKKNHSPHVGLLFQYRTTGKVSSHVAVAMEALRHISTGGFNSQDAQSSLPVSKRKPATIITARPQDNTGLLNIETTRYRTDILAQELRKAQPKTDDDGTVDGQPAKKTSTK
jgi:hypothetical protein